MVKKAIAGFLTILFLTVFPAGTIARVNPMDFADIQGHWAYTPITQMITTGYMDGVGVNDQGNPVFAPNAWTTRAQAAAVLTRVFRLDYGSKRFVKQPLAADYYSDVDNDAWYADGVVMCAINDVFPTGGKFSPDHPISRLEMAHAIQNCFEAKGITVVMIMMMPIYQDTQDLSAEDSQALAFVTNTGIMKGDNNYFRPHDPLSRGELAQVLATSLAVVKKHVDLDETNNGQQYEVTEGQFFNVTLPENPTTGYRWNYIDEYDQTILSQVDHSFQAPPETQPPVVGQGGWSLWRFKALQPGTTTIKLGYSRPWEANPPAQTYEVRIIVVSDSSQTGVTDVSITGKEIKESSEIMKTELNIPVISGLASQEVQDAVNSRWEQDALTFNKEVSSGVAEYVQSRLETDAPVFPYEAVTDYAYHGITGSILSLTVNYYQYTGGAHGGTARRAYNIDINTGKDVQVKDLFQNGYDYESAISRIIIEKIQSDPGNYFSGPEMGFTSIDKQQQYYIDNDQLVIYFDQYEIAPYAAGIPEFKIPLADLKLHLTVQ